MSFAPARFEPAQRKIPVRAIRLVVVCALALLIGGIFAAAWHMNSSIVSTDLPAWKPGFVSAVVACGCAS
jgi:TRAP-type C4-dicarboxylate transport system permease small subunit